MKRTDPIHVAVAETSVIVRSGLISVLKRLPDIPVQPVEITSMEGLHNCMQGHRPEVLIVNPGFGGLCIISTSPCTSSLSQCLG